jgi:DNA-binding winged helix-turn-helix (wHTH) protein
MAREDSGAARSAVSAAVPVTEEQSPASGTVVFGPYTLRVSLRRLERNGIPVRVGDRAFDLLCVLTERAGEIVTNRELMARVWGNVVVGAGSLRFHINALRRVLSQDGRRAPYIKNVTRRGYTFIAPVRSVATGTVETQEIAKLLSQPRFISLMGPEGVQALREQLAIRCGESVTLIAIVLGNPAMK